MTKMQHYVEEMRARLGEVASTEQSLVRALDQALSAVDQQLLADVRDLTMAHEARRTAILQELQHLASRIGAFPSPADPHPVLEADAQALAQVYDIADVQDGTRVGDWRQAVSNIKDDLDDLFGHTLQH